MVKGDNLLLENQFQNLKKMIIVLDTFWFWTAKVVRLPSPRYSQTVKMETVTLEGCCNNAVIMTH